MKNNKKVILGLTGAVVAIAALLAAVVFATTMTITNSNAQIVASPQTNATTTATTAPMDTTFTAQKTAVSVQDELPGHEKHQAVVVLPERDDGKIWVGTVSWTASKPVEVRLLHTYDSSVSPDVEHGEPVTAPFGNGSAAISLILANGPAATVPSYYSGSLDFAATQVAFHTLGGAVPFPFTVTYTIDAEAKELTE
jgi:hypothetical protein